MKGKIVRSEAEWRKLLTPEQYKVLREGGTECAFTGEYFNHKGTGTYACAACGLELFHSDLKFESGTGWPSFWKAVKPDNIRELEDNSLGMRRIEILCARCDSHLGHVFNDGPAPTGLRYCANSVSLTFIPGSSASSPNTSLRTATFASGCFWCSDAAFRSLSGVVSVEVGYMGGTTKNPTYKEVCTGRTGHAEVSRVTYDPKRLSYGKLLELFWKIHDPTSLNRQGEDVGTQYRSAIFHDTPEQKAEAEASMQALQKTLAEPVVTEIVQAGEFYRAEDYHQDYFRKNPGNAYCNAVIRPKLKKLGITE